MSDYQTFESLGGTVKRLRRLVDPEVKTWSAFNPSIAMAPDGSMAMTIRSSNYIVNKISGQYELATGGTVKNETWFCELDEDFNIQNLRKLSYGEVPYQDIDVKLVRGAEDAKLFWRGGWKFLAVVKENHCIPVPRIGLFELNNDKAELLHICGFDGQNPERVEKNWMTTYEENPNFDYVYNENSVIKYRERFEVRDSYDVIKDLRGNSHLWDLKDDTYLALVHRTKIKKITYFDAKSFGYKNGALRDYFHYFARYDSSGRLFALTDAFKFISSGIEFGAGLIVKNNEVIVTFGVNDESSYLGKISLETVLGMLKEV